MSDHRIIHELDEELTMDDVAAATVEGTIEIEVSYAYGTYYASQPGVIYIGAADTLEGAIEKFVQIVEAHDDVQFDGHLSPDSP